MNNHQDNAYRVMSVIWLAVTLGQGGNLYTFLILEDLATAQRASHIFKIYVILLTRPFCDNFRGQINAITPASFNACIAGLFLFISVSPVISTNLSSPARSCSLPNKGISFSPFNSRLRVLSIDTEASSHKSFNMWTILGGRFSSNITNILCCQTFFKINCLFN